MILNFRLHYRPHELLSDRRLGFSYYCEQIASKLNSMCGTVLTIHLHKHAIQSLEKVIDDEEKANGDAPLGPKVAYRIAYLLGARRLRL